MLCYVSQTKHSTTLLITPSSTHHMALAVVVHVHIKHGHVRARMLMKYVHLRSGYQATNHLCGHLVLGLWPATGKRVWRAIIRCSASTE